MSKNDIAVLSDGETAYRATSPKGCFGIESAPFLLIQAIYDLKPSDARRLVRHRIFTSAPLTPLLQGIVKVAAKRVTACLASDAPELQVSGLKIVDVDPSQFLRSESPQLPAELPSSRNDREWMDLAVTLKQQSINAKRASDSKARTQTIRRDRAVHPLSRYQMDRPIAAILVSKEGRLLEAAVNTNGKNRTLHAEINLLSQFIRRERKLLPAGATLYTTLKPCKMCAGAIHDSAEDLASLRVIYLENDPGRNAQHTALDGLAGAVQSQLPKA